MIADSATLAQNITKVGSKQTYYTTKLLVDGELEHDCYRAYAYFRWVDDYIDDVANDSKNAAADHKYKVEIETKGEVVGRVRCEMFGCCHV